MRQTISRMIAAVAVMMTASAAPAMACGGLFTSCSPCGYTACAPVYVAPVATYSGCYSGCGWSHERLADPVHQYYYVNQGPTYTGPGAWAPERTYQEGSISYGRPYYGYRARGYGYGYGVGVRPAYRYGYGARLGYGARHGYYGGARYGMRHGGYHGAARMGMGGHQHMMRHRY